MGGSETMQFTKYFKPPTKANCANAKADLDLRSPNMAYGIRVLSCYAICIFFYFTLNISDMLVCRGVYIFFLFCSFVRTYVLTYMFVWAGFGGSVRCASDWWSGSCGFDLRRVGIILSWRLIMKYFLRSFSPFHWFKKGSFQFLAKECAQYWLTAWRTKSVQ